jgi:hypothetical protein
MPPGCKHRKHSLKNIAVCLGRSRCSKKCSANMKAADSSSNGSERRQSQQTISGAFDDIHFYPPPQRMGTRPHVNVQIAVFSKTATVPQHGSSVPRCNSNFAHKRPH